MPVSVIVSGTPARVWLQEQLGRAARAAEHVHEADRGAPRAAGARGERRELLHEPLRAPVVAGGEGRLVRRGDDHGVDRGVLGGAQQVPAAVEVRVEKLVGIDLGPVDVLVGGQVEDEVGPRAAELGGDAPAVADVAQHVVEMHELERVARAAVGGERGLVAVHERHELGPEAEQQRGQRARDRAAAARDQHAPAAHELLELEYRGHRIGAAQHLLPVERAADAAAGAGARSAPPRARRSPARWRGRRPSWTPSASDRARRSRPRCRARARRAGARRGRGRGRRRRRGAPRRARRARSRRAPPRPPAPAPRRSGRGRARRRRSARTWIG